MLRKLFSLIVRCVVYIVIIIVTVTATIALYNARLGKLINAPLQCNWSFSVGSVEKNLRYAEGDFGCYDLYLPADTTAHSLILFIHGGGFTGGDKADEEPWCKFFTSKGYVTAIRQLHFGRWQTPVKHQ